MTNSWLKNRAVVWVLTFVFLFTSVFSTGTAFAETEPAVDPAAVETVTDEAATEDAVTDENTVADDSVTIEEATGTDEAAAEQDAAVTEDTVITEEVTEEQGTYYGEDDDFWEPSITGLTLQEQDTVISKDNKVINLIFTVNGISSVGDAYVNVYSSETYNTYYYQDYEVESTGNENEFKASFELDAEVEGSCYISGFMIDGGGYGYYCYDENDNPKFTFDVEIAYDENFVINGMSFINDFDGVIEITDDMIDEKVYFDLDITMPDDENYSALNLWFENKEADDEMYMCLWFDEETRTFDNYCFIGLAKDLEEGTYTLERAVLDWEKKVKLNFDEEVSFEYKESHSDREAPVLNDMYFTLDGVKCEEYGFNVTEDIVLKAYLDIDDENGVDTSCSAYELHSPTYYWMEQGFRYDKELGLYVGTTELELLRDGEWYVGNVMLVDKYYNEANYKVIADKNLQGMYFFKGEDITADEYEYEVGFSVLDNESYDYITCKRETSLDEISGYIPEIPEVENAEFLGWKSASGELITSNSQKVYMNSNSTNYFWAKFDKPIIKVYVYAGEADYQLYFGIDDGATWGDLKAALLDSGVLEKYEHDIYDEVFDRWEMYQDEEEAIYLDDGYNSTSIYARYRTSYVKEFTFDANGGTYADGTTSKTMELDVFDRDAVESIEKPVREGYIFTGWRDGEGCDVTNNLEESCTNDVYAKWISSSDASISYAYLKYATDRDIYMEDGEEYVEWNSYYIWDEGRGSKVSLPFNVNPDYVKLWVKKKDGTVVEQPVELVNGAADVTYDSVSADGTNTVTYTVKITTEEPPTAPYDTYVRYYDEYYSEEEYSTGTRSFEIEGTTGTVTVPYKFCDDQKITIRGYDIDGSWFESEGIVMGDADEVTITYTSAVNGQVYTVTVKRAEPIDDINFEVAIREYYEYDYSSLGWYMEDEFRDNTLNKTVPYGTFDALKENGGQIGVTVYPYSESTVDLPYDEMWGERTVYAEPVDGKATATFTMTAESGRSETYTVNITEDPGDKAELSWLEYTYNYKDREFWRDLESGQITSANGAVAKIPYYYDNEAGITVYPHVTSGMTVEGLKDKYTFDADGNCVAEFKIISANGQVTKDCKITFVKEMAPKEPFSMKAYYYDKNGGHQEETLEFEDNIAEFYVYHGYDAESGITVEGYDVDDSWISGNIALTEGKDSYTFTSVNGQQYTVKAVALDANSDISCSARIRADWGDDYDYVSVDMREAYEKGETTVTVPYGTITDSDGYGDNSIRLDVFPCSSTSKPDLENSFEEEGDVDYEGYYEILTPDNSGKLTKTFTITAESGDQREYKINIIEESGALPDINWIDACYKFGGEEVWQGVDTELLLATGEATVKIPYYYDAENGITFAGYTRTERIDSLYDQKVTLDPTGNGSFEFTVPSANGAMEYTYKLNLVREAEPAAPYDMYLNYHAEYYEVEEADCYEWFKFDEAGKTAEVYIPADHGDVELCGRDIDGKRIEVPVTVENGKGTITYTSANGKEYTVNVIVSGQDSTVGCSAYVYAENGETGRSCYANFDSTGETTAEITVPYGTITDADGYNDNVLTLYVDPYGRDAVVDDAEYKYGEYTPELKANGDGTYTSTFTVTAANGDKQTYTVNVKEDSGDKIDIEYMEAYFPEAFTGYYYEPNELWENIDFEKAATEEGVTITVPYSANDSKGLWIYGNNSFGKMKGLNKRYFLDKEGNATVTVKATSPNGKNTEIYTIHFVKDKVGDGNQLQRVTFNWGDNTGGDFYGSQVADLTKAATESGDVICVPGIVFDDETKWLEMNFRTEGHEKKDVEIEYECGVKRADEEDGNWCPMEVDRYGEAVVKLTVTSENREVAKVYKFKVINADDCDHVYDKVEIPATCIKEGQLVYTCKSCGYSYTEVITSPGHSYTAAVTAPTCTAEGYTTYTCVCGDSYVTDKVAAKGHTYGEWIVDTTATCEKAGSKHKECVCGDKITEAIEATGHSHKATVTAPTCTAEGYTTYACACGDSYVTDKVAALGHNAVEKTTKATTEKAGSVVESCKTCGEQLSKKTIAKISKTTISATKYVYNGKIRKPVITVKDSKGKKLVKDKDYTVTYKNAKATKKVTAKNVGKYTVVVTFKGNYSGTAKKTFVINPQSTTVKKLTKPAKKQIKVTWNKRTAQVTGYELKYSTSKKFTKSTTKTVKITKAKTTSKVIKKLKSKKTYYVKIRTYKTVNGVKYYSGWSKAKSIKTK